MLSPNWDEIPQSLQDFLFHNSVFARAKVRVIYHLHFGTVIAFLPE